MSDPAVTFDEIRQIPEHFIAMDASKFQATRANIVATLKTKGINADSYIDVLTHCAWVQQSEKPTLTKPIIALYAALHGIAPDEKKKVSAYVNRLTNGEGSLNNICEMLNSDFRVYELDLEEPNNDFSKTDEPALEEDDAARACAYGMMAVEQGADVIYLGSVGQGPNISGQCLLTTLGYDIAEPYVLNADLISKAKALHKKKNLGDGLDLLQQFGGYDHCSILGAMIAARLANVPVFIDSWAGLACAMILNDLQKGAADHIFFVDDLPNDFEAPIAQMDLSAAVDYPAGFAGPCHLLTVKALAAVLIAQTALPQKVVSIDKARD